MIPILVFVLILIAWIIAGELNKRRLLKVLPEAEVKLQLALIKLEYKHTIKVKKNEEHRERLQEQQNRLKPSSETLSDDQAAQLLSQGQTKDNTLDKTEKGGAALIQNIIASRAGSAYSKDPAAVTFQNDCWAADEQLTAERPFENYNKRQNK